MRRLIAVFLWGVLAGASFVQAQKPNPVDSAAEQKTARVYLKEQLQDLNQAYPFTEWNRRLEALHQEFETFAAHHPMTQVYAPDLKRDYAKFAAQLDSLRVVRPKVEALIHEMYVEVMVSHIEALFQREGKTLSPEGREVFYRALKPYEAGSLRPKTDYLAHLVAMDQKFNQWYSAWLFNWARTSLPQSIEFQLGQTGFGNYENQRQQISQQIDYWVRQIDSDATPAAQHLKTLDSTLRGQRPPALAGLAQLQSALQPEMLFSDLLDQAKRENLSFTVEAEDRVEEALAARQASILQPVHERVSAWMELEPRLAAARKKAAEGEQRQLRLARTREEHERLEQARLAALELEQKKTDDAEREQFHDDLNSWKNAGSGLADLDSATHNALALQPGRLQTSVLGNGRKTLRVETSKFSDTLAFVEKFTVADNRIDLSKMSLEEKTTQSAYVYASPSGRTNPKDLDQFVQNVALGSFNAYYNFLSYLAPEHWKSGRTVAWKADRAAEPVAQDRVFSYVDMVVDAHRKYQKKTSTAADRARVNIPANLIVIFDEQGGVKRYQSFADSHQLAIRPGDLDHGRLRYKFLNYSVDRGNIYLNGIDAEIKVSAPDPG